MATNFMWVILLNRAERKRYNNRIKIRGRTLLMGNTIWFITILKEKPWLGFLIGLVFISFMFLSKNLIVYFYSRNKEKTDKHWLPGRCYLGSISFRCLPTANLAPSKPSRQPDNSRVLLVWIPISPRENKLLPYKDDKCVSGSFIIIREILTSKTAIRLPNKPYQKPV